MKKIIYIETNAAKRMNIDVEKENILLKIHPGSKRKAYKKFGVFDDDLDLAHRFVATVKQRKCEGVLIAWDEDVIRWAIRLLDSETAENVALVHLVASYGAKISLKYTLEKARCGHLLQIRLKNAGQKPA